MGNTNVDMLAGDRDLNPWEPTKIFAGEMPIFTDKGVAGADIKMYQPVYRKAEDGKLYPFDDTAAALEGEAAVFPVGISAQATVKDKSVQFYTGGCFNVDAIVWPSTIDDLVKAKSLFELKQATISFRKLY